MYIHNTYLFDNPKIIFITHKSIRGFIIDEIAFQVGVSLHAFFKWDIMAAVGPKKKLILYTLVLNYILPSYYILIENKILNKRPAGSL